MPRDAERRTGASEFQLAMIEQTFRLTEMLLVAGAAGLADLHAPHLATFLISNVLRLAFAAYGIAAPALLIHSAQKDGPVSLSAVSILFLAFLYLSVFLAGTWTLFNLESFAGLFRS